MSFWKGEVGHTMVGMKRGRQFARAVEDVIGQGIEVPIKTTAYAYYVCTNTASTATSLAGRYKSVCSIHFVDRIQKQDAQLYRKYMFFTGRCS
jgi:hypothetical protein